MSKKYVHSGVHFDVFFVCCPSSDAIMVLLLAVVGFELVRGSQLFC